MNEDKKTGFDPLAIVTEQEAIQYMLEGMRQAASRARQMGRAQQHPIWLDVGVLLDELHNHAKKLSESKPMGRQTLLHSLEVREKRVADEARPPGILLN